MGSRPSEAWATPACSSTTSWFRATPTGDPAQRSLESRCEIAINSLEMRGIGRCIAQPVPAVIAGLPALTYEIRLTRGRLLIEWKFDCQGWYFGAGILQSMRDDAEGIALGRASLATWTWT